MGLSQIGNAGWQSLKRRLPRGFRRRSFLRQQLPAEMVGGGWASLLCAQPAIIGSWPTNRFPLGVASALGPWLHGAPIEFLIMPTWAWELPEVAESILAAVADHVRKHPRHRFSFLCNSSSQEGRLAGAGWPVTTLNWNMFINESFFRPLPEIEPIYDAIYNARLSPDKRPELAAEIERLCLVYFYNALEGSVASFHDAHARLRALMPGATFLNRLTAGGCERLSRGDVNRAMNRSRIGLCLSAVEGQMQASMEYLMAGLPIVSTPSIGGRDYFFDAEYCAIVEPDPRLIRDAVAAMIQRNIPREHVRAQTMHRVERERARFVHFVQNLIERRGGRTDFAAIFPGLLRDERLIPWVHDFREFARRVDRAMLSGDLNAG